MSFPRYPKYKDSGVEWLGEVPEHWSTAKLGHRLKSPPCYGVLVPDFEEDGVPMLRITDMEDGNANRANLNRISPSLSAQYSRTIVEEGDVVLSVVGTIGEAFRVDAALAGVNLSRAVARIQIESALTAEFLCWVFQTLQFRRYVDLICVGTAQRVLNMGDLSAFRLGTPDPTEQTAIAAFLDRETAKIDGLVAEQRRLMELLKEKRQAVISHAVTKGLNPDAPMKPSSIEWLGDLPEHWEVRSIARISTKITNGYVGPTRDILVEVGVPYIQATHIKRGRVNFNGGYFVTQPWSDAHAKSILAEGDVLIVQTGAGTGDVGLVSDAEVGFNCHALIIVACDKEQLSGPFLASVLQSEYGRQRLESIQTGGMHPHLNCGNVKFVEIPVPPEDEQARIVLHIQEACGDFDALIAEAHRAIDLLQERRTALISAAVTGQIDARQFASEVAA